MSRFFFIAGLILIGFLGMGGTQAPNLESPFSLQLVVPISTPQGQREISLDRYRELHVLLTNKSPIEQRVWKDWNTWGYFNLSLEWKASGRTFPIYRQTQKNWDGDFPDYWTLEPGETLVLAVDMISGEWKGFPDLYGEVVPAFLKATYQNKPDELADAFDIWVGKIESQEVEVIFR